MKLLLATQFFFSLTAAVALSHELENTDSYNPNQAFLSCVKSKDQATCENQFPITYRQIIPGKYLQVDIESSHELCFNLAKLTNKQPKVTLHSIIGKTATYTFRPDNMSPTEHRELQQSISIHIHRTTDTPMCADGSGFRVDVGSEFIEIWKQADEKDRYPFWGRDIWVSYQRGDWRLPFQFWK